ncbi:hypothetical protein Xoosp13_204 [Xanthomonas phage Xoo-sp13]|nr:hypothetical protein Xoosp13_204 [Xanthomonas phage Xoo-sp13]
MKLVQRYDLPRSPETVGVIVGMVVRNDTELHGYVSAINEHTITLTLFEPIAFNDYMQNPVESVSNDEVLSDMRQVFRYSDELHEIWRDVLNG